MYRVVCLHIFRKLEYLPLNSTIFMQPKPCLCNLLSYDIIWIHMPHLSPPFRTLETCSIPWAWTIVHVSSMLFPCSHVPWIPHLISSVDRFKELTPRGCRGEGRFTLRLQLHTPSSRPSYRHNPGVDYCVVGSNIGMLHSSCSYYSNSEFSR